MIYIPDGIMEAYFMLLNYETLFQLLFGQGCEIKIFLTEWLYVYFQTMRSTSFNKTMMFLAHVLHCINQAVHLYLDSCSKNTRVDVKDNVLNQEDKRDLSKGYLTP